MHGERGPRTPGLKDLATRLPSWLLGAAVLATIAAYLPGLSGPLLLDDGANLESVFRYASGEGDWQAALAGSEASPTPRLVSMLSFLGNAASTGSSLYAMKATNLALHVSTGVVLFWFCLRLFELDPVLRARGPLAAALVTSAWMLLPIHVSTVLYLVQRMAQLSGLFTLLALVLYLESRRAAGTGRVRAARALLWVGVPGATVLAVLSKESGALAPLLCGVVHACYLQRAWPVARSRELQAFWTSYLFVPALLGISWLALEPDIVFAGYATRDFTLPQRLLTELRVLWDYVGAILLPQGARLGLVHDDFPASVGLLTPATTVLALLGWLAALAGALAGFRLGHRSVLVGVLLYLASHALESTVFPLELYFEHRNYLASAGVLIAVSGIVGWIAQALPAEVARERLARVACLALLAVIASYALATWLLAGYWRSEELIYRHALTAHPGSYRLRMEYGRLLATKGDVPGAMEQLDAAALANPPHAGSVELAKLFVECSSGRAIPPVRYANIASRPPRRITMTELGVLEGIALNQGGPGCQGVDLAALTDATRIWLERDAANAGGVANWRFRALHALLLAHANQLRPALREALAAWRDSGMRIERGIFAFQLAAAVGDRETCVTLLEDMRRRYRGRDPRVIEFLEHAEAQADADAAPHDAPGAH